MPPPWKASSSSPCKTKSELPGFWFNQSEVYALLTMQQLLADLEPGLLAAHVEPLKARLAMLLEEAGSSLETVEHRVIDPTSLDEERRSALWLYAWNYETRRRKPGFARRSSPRR